METIVRLQINRNATWFFCIVVLTIKYVYVIIGFPPQNMKVLFELQTFPVRNDFPPWITVALFPFD